MSDERLPGYQLLGKGGFGCSSLWLGEDHLLYIDAVGFLLPIRERYRRYAYADLESVVLVENSLRSLGSLILGVIVLVAAGSLLSLFQDGVANAVAGVAVVISTTVVLLGGFLLVGHVVRGACCMTVLTTRTGRVCPRPMRRCRTARVALRRLEERIRESGSGKGRREASAIAEAGLRGNPQAPRLPKTAFPAFALNGALALWLAAVIWLSWAGAAAAIVTSLLAFAATLCLLLALASMSRQPAPLETRVLLWSLIGPLLILGLGGLLCFAMFSVQRPEMATAMFGLAQVFGDIRATLPASVTTCFMLLCAAMVLFASVGLVTSMSWRSPAQRAVDDGGDSQLPVGEASDVPTGNR